MGILGGGGGWYRGYPGVKGGKSLVEEFCFVAELSTVKSHLIYYVLMNLPC